MKAITLWQPWASFMALGLKKNETRHWPLDLTGPIAIHAAKKLVRIDDPYFQEAFKKLNITYDDLPRGAVLCWFEKMTCIKITPNNVPPFPERAFGDYTSGRYMYKMSGLNTLSEPFYVGGAQGVWNWNKGAGTRRHIQQTLF